MPGDAASMDVDALLDPTQTDDERALFGLEKFTHTDASAPLDGAMPLAPMPLGRVLVDPLANVSRGGTMDPFAHPDVRRIAATLRASESFLIHGLGLRTLLEPVARPCGANRPCCTPEAMARDGVAVPVHTVSLHYGFRRWTALVGTDRTHLFPSENEIKWLVHPDGRRFTDEECAEANLAENTARGDPTEYHLAVEFQRRLALGTPAAALAMRTGRSELEILDGAAIVRRLPASIKAAWARNPNPKIRRILVRIARTVDPDDMLNMEDRHERMVQAWDQEQARVTADDAARRAPPSVVAEPMAPTPPAGPPAPDWLGRKGARGFGQGRSVGSGSTSLASVRRAVDTAREWCDATGTWRPLAPGERALLQAVLAAMRRGETPLR